MIKIINFISKNLKKEGKKIFLFSLLSILVVILWKISDEYLIEIPTSGGTIAEIQIGSNVRFINPILARSNAEKDLLPLVYSSLLKRDDDGKIIPGIAEMEISDDKKIYTIKIKENIFFSNGQKLTTDDIIFTIDKINDPELNSHYYGNWFGVKYEKINEKELKIRLPQEYNQFEEILASFYILPKNLWQNFSPSEFEHNPLNIKAIGSGPYIIKEITRGESGKIQRYELERNEKNNEEKVFIDEIVFYFFENYQEYQESIIFSNKKIIKNIANVNSKLIVSLSSNKSYMNAEIEKIESPKIFGLFLNKNSQNFLKNKILRKAISEIIDKNRINNITSNNYTRKIESPIFNFKKENSEKNIESIKEELLKNNFSIIEKNNTITLKTPLLKNDEDFPSQDVILTIKTIDSEEFIEISKNIQDDLKKIGIISNILYYSEDFLANSIIRNRDFDILLFGYQTNINPDFYYLFHSSQISDPGINISGIRNTKIDKNILKLRKHIDEKEKLLLYKELDILILDDYSFIPIYSPYFIYIMDSRIKNFRKKIINSREERFSDISNWYTETKRILP